MEKVWKDHHLGRIVFVLVNILLIMLFVYFIVTADYNNLFSFYLGVLFILLFLFWLFNTIIRAKLTYITRKGIRIGNMPSHTYEFFFLKKNAMFLGWEKIKQVGIIRRVVRVKHYSVLKDFIVIKTKDGKKYECFLAQPKGFISALKSIKKYHLLSKESKYREILSEKKEVEK